MTYWPTEVAHRAPVNDFPPAWANAWGDDCYGLWADLMVQGVTQRMRWIEPTVGGGFWMGSTPEERRLPSHPDHQAWAEKTESNPHLVVVERGFWMADTPCTMAFWQAVTGNVLEDDHSGREIRRRPVVNVALDAPEHAMDIRRFLTKLSSKLGLRKADLPSEQQWEYACRADTLTPYWWGNDGAAIWAMKSDLARPLEEAANGLQLLTLLQPNPWGLYDMNGNVNEWCRDLWRNRLVDPGPLEHDTYVVRGAPLIIFPMDNRSARRVWRHAGERRLELGFRFIIHSDCMAQD